MANCRNCQNQMLILLREDFVISLGLRPGIDQQVTDNL